jgi:hypothetical protein
MIIHPVNTKVYKKSLLYMRSADVHARVFTTEQRIFCSVVFTIAKIKFFRMQWPTTVLVFPLFPTLLELIEKRAAPYPPEITTSDTYSSYSRIFPP